MRTIRQIAALGVGAALVAAVGLYVGAAATKAAFTLVAGQTPANGGLNFNGADKGHLVVTVPVGAQVEITLVNKGDLPHSIQIIPYTKTLPGSAEPRPAFPGAETPNPQTGITKGQTAVARFTATKPGKYLLICGFPGHALLGMYGIFDVVPQASAKPSLTITK
jgi:sulfocyanin